ncbi:MAG: two-component system regulatory protein YycI [Lactobacillaceae bacterium]|jgi:regulatory protein YycI of two-component signal transduction system YycFG|nr:two-component system regulatory protein YycI [Lactobacillaceae bacterium]
MDFKRVVIAFIGIFVLIDLFLGYQLVRVNQQDVSSNGNSAILSNMRNDNIKFQNLSNDSDTGDYIGGNGEIGGWEQKVNKQLIGMQCSFDETNNVLTVTPSERLELGDNSEEAQKTLDKMMKKPSLFFQGTKYVYDSEMTDNLNETRSKDGSYLVYQQVLPNHDQTLGEAGQIKIELNDKFELIKYTQTYIASTQILREPLPMISEEMAAIYLYQYNELPNNSEILWSKIGYSALIQVDNSTIFVPTWFVTIQNGATQTTLRINAFDGKLMN